MVNEWSLRREALSAAQNWPLFLVLCLAGALLGWIAAQVWPTPYQSSRELDVALNIYRWELDRNAVKFANNVAFSYPDDYKNWQMANLNVLVLGPGVLNQTLEALRQEDPAWKDASLQDFSEKAAVYWRNAGSWRLTVQDRDPRRANQAVTAWESVALKDLQAATGASKELILLDGQIQALGKDRSEALGRQSSLEQAKAALEAWQAQTQPETLEGADYWAITAIAARAAGFDPAWQALLAQEPKAGSPRSAFTPWVEGLQAAIDSDLQALAAQAQTYQQEADRLQKAYAAASEASLGFSPNLEVSPASSGPAQAAPLRPTSLLLATGALLGAIAWLVVQLARIQAKTRP